MAKATDPKALNEKGGEETTPEAPPAPEPKATEEVVKPDAPKEAEVKPTETEEESPKKPSKKGAEARIRKLSRRAKKAEGDKKSLADKLEEVTAQLGSQATPTEELPPLPPAVSKPIIQPGEEIDTNEFEKRMQERDQRVLQQAQNIASFQSKVDRVVNNINKEAKEAIADYPELDPKSEVFDKDLSDAVTEATEAQVKGNPTASVKGLVDKLMKPYKRAVTEEVGKAKENLAKQVSKTALRPTPTPKGAEKSFEDLSIDEMEDQLGTIR